LSSRQLHILRRGIPGKNRALGPVRDEADNPHRRDLLKEQEQNDHGHTDGYRPIVGCDPGYGVVDAMPIEDHEPFKLNADDPLAFGTPDDVRLGSSRRTFRVSVP
jgi:hypothetical protein